MFGFLKKIFGLPTTEEVAAAKQASAPYKVEPPVVNNKTGDVVDTPPIPYPELHKAPVEVEAKSRDELLAVNPQITDSVTQSEPVKKTRKPRTPKAEKPAKEKAAKKAAKKIAVVKRLKKA